MNIVLHGLDVFAVFLCKKKGLSMVGMLTTAL